jgi:hypothetical protein
MGWLRYHLRLSDFAASIDRARFWNSRSPARILMVSRYRRYALTFLQLRFVSLGRYLGAEGHTYGYKDAEGYPWDDMAPGLRCGYGFA